MRTGTEGLDQQLHGRRDAGGAGSNAHCLNATSATNAPAHELEIQLFQRTGFSQNEPALQLGSSIQVYLLVSTYKSSISS